MFDSVVNEAREKFNLGDRANSLLSAILSVITDKNHGGFAGLLDRLDKAGLGDVSSSWISSGANTPISGEQTEAAVGPVTLDDISKQTGIDYKTTVAATAFMLPRIVDEISADGVVPNDDDLRSRYVGHLSENENTVAERFDRIGTAAVSMTDEKGDISVNELDEKESDLKRLLPVIIVLLLIILGFWFCSKAETHKSQTINPNVFVTSNG
jgi:uncharacterized protein YidB (DUF937 family)